MSAEIQRLCGPFPAADISPPRPILVVDDSRAQRAMVGKMLRGWGHDVVEADCGARAMEICRERRIDLVLTDWMMPGLDGPGFCSAFREFKGREPGYVILLTAQTERQKVAEGLDAGADDFLSKPVHPVELRARVRAGQRIIAAQSAVTSSNRLLTRALEELTQVHSAIDRDLMEARKLQNALVPRREVSVEGARITLLFRPSGRVGGDLVGFFPAGPRRFGVFSVDVAGHGIASALLMARVAGHLTSTSADRNVALHSDGDTITPVPPAEVCRRLNRILLEDVESDHYLTMIFADCDLSSGRCILSQAGHPSPMVQRRGGGIEFPSSFGMPIGLLEDAEYSEFEVDLEPGDRLLLFTDGVTECADRGGQLLEEAGLRRAAHDLGEKIGADFTEGLVDWLQSHQQAEEFEDDLSAALIERTG